MDRPIVIYHGHCTDGFTAAWAVRRKFPNAELVAGFHSDTHTPPDVLDRDVIMVDFAYPRATMHRLEAQARSILVLDHHITTQADLEGFPNTVFDLNRSGAGLAWDHFFPDEPRPWLVDYVEDRDLWRKALPNSDTVTAFIRSFAPSFTRWDALAAMSLDEAVAHGGTVWSYVQLQVEYACKRARRTALGGYANVWEVNSGMLQSEIGHQILVDHPEADFAAVWFIGLDGSRKYSLRSEDHRVDVSQVAKQFGGGGHRNSAGFGYDGDPSE